MLRASSLLPAVLVLLIPVPGFANGGPFFIAYPDGDNSAKGVLAVLGENLLPVKEGRLRVVAEALTITFGEELPAARLEAELGGRSGRRFHFPYEVEARYQIENLTDDALVAYFAFPVLGGHIIQVPTMAGLSPSFKVRVDGHPAGERVLYPLHIHGLLRERAHAGIDRWMQATPSRREYVEAIRSAEGEKKAQAVAAFVDHLRREGKLARGDAELLADLVSLDIVADSTPMVKMAAADGAGVEYHAVPAARLVWLDPVGEWQAALGGRYLGPLAAIGDQKATQLWTHVASVVDPGNAYAYEDLFQAWGGETRELALDLDSGRTRPRENAVGFPPQVPDAGDATRAARPDLRHDVLYGRVDYLEGEDLTDAVRPTLERILENLPVIFSYTPMALGVYQVEFAPHQAREVRVTYAQDSFLDTKGRKSYQMCYVVQTALNWAEFGRIDVQVRIPESYTPVFDPPLEREMVEAGKATYATTLATYDRNLRIAIPVPPETGEEAEVGQTATAGREGQG